MPIRDGKRRCGEVDRELSGSADTRSHFPEVEQRVTARREFEDFITAHEQVIECFPMSGEWDYLIRVSVKDVRDYEQFLMHELLAHPAIATSASHFALKRVKYTTAIPV